MSLYTFKKTDTLPSLKNIEGLNIRECSDINLLASIATTTASNIADRIRNGHKAFVAYFKNQPAAFGWIATRSATIGELNHEIKLPEGNRYLWNFRTLEPYRGMGIYPRLLQYIIRNEIETAEQFWIIHAPENKASLNGIVKAGFQFVGTLYINKSGLVMVNAQAENHRAELVAATMNIPTSPAIPASCWNCSSPYLTKRMKKCCCAIAATECVGRNELVMPL